MSVRTSFSVIRSLRAFAWITACALLVGLSFQQPARAQSGPTLDSEEQAFLVLINDYRRQNGLGPLQVSATMTNAAKWLSNDMGQKNYFSHTDSLGRDPYKRMADFGYAYSVAKGENIAAGNSTAAATFEQWRNSPGHNQAMLTGAFTAIGIGRAYVPGSTYRYYWTTDFGGYLDQTITLNSRKNLHDYDGDGKADLTVWGTTTGLWSVLQSGNGAPRYQQWGLLQDIPVPGDYDGDGKNDFAVWRPSTGVWYIIYSSTNTVKTQVWGLQAPPYGDIPVPADYDGDGKTDFAVWRSLTGVWFIINSSNGTVKTQAWGLQTAPYGDIAVPADYDGDGKADFAVWRSSSGVWFIINSSNGTVKTQSWGVPGDQPVPGDYDGDGKADFAVWRPSNGVWYIINSSRGTVKTQTWGLPSDKLVPADYDGDGKLDIAVWRPSTGVWHIINSSTGTAQTPSWGIFGDQPL